MREERLLGLVSLIHETVFSSEGWATFAAGLESAIPGSALSLIVPKEGDVPVIEVVDRDSLEWHAPSFREDLVPLFLERFRYPDENPFAIPRTFPPGSASVHWSNDLVSLDEFRKGAMFNEWIAPQDLALGPNLVVYLYSGGRPHTSPLSASAAA